ncbi:serine/threonine-protein kinase [Calidifontibacter indicus]|uniref:non-specific serine/threonine protein kinase n=1 Tax=Calidifontibacter indicus TaxID=419650 RepID=A0A3D9V253_9MICO|nr:serine/threonine-protein kinase [Calidifontibacter indicus]REF31171.1 serine/threonine-protein kinase [Calidifontibacter indicus]
MTDDRVGTTFGPYRIVDLIGRGGMGEVYRAYDTVKDREVALKLLPRELAGDASYRDRFEREARVAARLQEPHVIPIHDFGRIDDVLFMDMRLVRGRDLRTVLRRPDRMDVAFAVDLVRQMTDALGAAHADGLVHRDVKPENILLLPSGFAYLADFGIAARTNEARMTSAGTAIGSFAYMAPERFQDAPVSPACDIYSLGCVLYECLAGRPPFPRGSVSALIQAHLSETPERVSALRSDVSPELDAVIARAMAKDPRQRFPSAREFGEAATAALSGTGAATHPPDPTTAPTMTVPAFTPRRPHESATAVPLAGGITHGATYGTGRADHETGYAAGQLGQRTVNGNAGGGNGYNGSSHDGDTQRLGRRPSAALLAALAAVLLLAGFAAWQAFGRDGSKQADGPGPGTTSGTTSQGSSSPNSTTTSTTTSSTTSTTSTTTSVSTQPNGHTTTVTVTQSSSPSSSSESTSESSTTESTTESTTTSTSTSSSPTWGTTIPAGPGYDWQGWTGYSAVRCGGDDRAAMVASSDNSLITICETHSGRMYYLGMRPNQATRPNSLRLADPVRSEGGWLAKTSNGTYSYLVTSSALTISNSKTGASDAEPMNTYVEAG